MSVSPSVRAAWQANLRINRALLDHLEPELLSAQTPGGGFTVAQHLAEIVDAVKGWGTRFDQGRLAPLPDLYDPKAETFVAETDLARIVEVMEQTYEAALEAAEAAREMGDSPHASPDAYLIHMMVHDAHHRGQILLALKTNGQPLPDEDRMWGPWKGA